MPNGDHYYLYNLVCLLMPGRRHEFEGGGGGVNALEGGGLIQ